MVHVLLELLLVVVLVGGVVQDVQLDDLEDVFVDRAVVQVEQEDRQVRPVLAAGFSGVRGVYSTDFTSNTCSLLLSQRR